MPNVNPDLVPPLVQQKDVAKARWLGKGVTLLSLFVGSGLASLLSHVPFHGRDRQHLSFQQPSITTFDNAFNGFGGFPNFGGVPGGGPSQDVDNTKFYDILEVDKNANPDDIKKAFRKIAVRHHPDKGGEPEKFKEVARAYEVLSNPEMREKYDKYGEDGIKDGGGGNPADIFDIFFGRRKGGARSKQKTKDIEHDIKVTLEDLYMGRTKKMAITRQVVDRDRGLVTCRDCNGQGTKIQAVRIGLMSQQMPVQCGSCGGKGKSFPTKASREILELYIQKGSPLDHKLVFREKADEKPEMDTGDVIFTLKEKEHKTFKRRGADLFLEKTISLVEALCGFEMEVEHLDGRKILIKTGPDDIVCPAAPNFDPLAAGEGKSSEWECIEGHDCPGRDVFSLESTDFETLKKAVETQLKKKGISVGAFVLFEGKTYFKKGTREEILEAKFPKKGCTLYVVADPDANRAMRMVKAVKGEGMPTFKNPLERGNLFLLLTIQFPDKLTEESKDAIRSHLPPPLHVPNVSAIPDEDVYTITDLDPVQSFNDNRYNMETNDAYESDNEAAGPGGPNLQCPQQ